jgi:hypothetical protein
MSSDRLFHFRHLAGKSCQSGPDTGSRPNGTGLSKLVGHFSGGAPIGAMRLATTVGATTDSRQCEKGLFDCHDWAIAASDRRPLQKY